MKDRLCEFGSCTIETTTVVVSDRGDRNDSRRVGFCGRTHAALWLLQEEGHKDLASEIEDDIKAGRTL
jgi:hypothetical protein